MDGGLVVQLRNVRWEDAAFLYALRIQPDVARWSFKHNPSWQDHLEHMEYLVSPNAQTQIIEADGVPVGSVGFNAQREITIALMPRTRQHGIGRRVLQKLKEYHSVLVARVIIGNTAALKFFVACGFEIVGADDEPKPHVVMKWEDKQ